MNTYMYIASLHKAIALSTIILILTNYKAKTMPRIGPKKPDKPKKPTEKQAPSMRKSSKKPKKSYK